MRIKIKVRVLFVDRFYLCPSAQIFRGSNCRRNKCHGTDFLPTIIASLGESVNEKPAVFVAYRRGHGDTIQTTHPLHLLRCVTDYGRIPEI